MISAPESIKFGSTFYDRRPGGVILERLYVLEDCLMDRFPEGFDVPGMPGNVRPVAPDPMIFPLCKDINRWPQTDFCWFPERWQWYLVHGLAMAKYHKFWSDLTRDEKSLIITAFKGLTGSDKVFNNNGHGTDEKNCYPSVTGRDEEIRGEDPRWESLIIGRQDYDFLPAVENSKGEKMRQIVSFYSYNVPPDPSYDMLEDSRWGICKVINPDCTVQRFPQLQGIDVPFLVLTNGPRFYPERYTRPA